MYGDHVIQIVKHLDGHLETKKKQIRRRSWQINALSQIISIWQQITQEHSLKIDIASTNRLQLATFQYQIARYTRTAIMEFQFVNQQFGVLADAQAVAIVQMPLVWK